MIKIPFFLHGIIFSVFHYWNCFLVFGYCCVMLFTLYLKSTHKNSLLKTTKCRLIDATLNPGN